MLSGGLARVNHAVSIDKAAQRGAWWSDDGSPGGIERRGRAPGRGPVRGRTWRRSSAGC